MARESKRKRDEKRFGKPERLADKILCGDYELGYPSWTDLPDTDIKEWAYRSEALCQTMIASRPIIVADNVAEYHYSVNSRSTIDYSKDFPNCRPPFPKLFIEFRRPQWFRDANGVRPFGTSFPEQWGQIVDTIPIASLPRTTGHAAIDEGLLPLLGLPGVTHIIRFVGVELQKNILVPGAFTGFLPITERGVVLDRIKILLSVFGGANGTRVADAMKVIDNRGQFFHCSMIAFSFMNCKNVATRAVNPEPRMNRKRAQANLKPFLRYHTIDIEPMKEVLRTEGRVETNGLAKAMHICRGHFATYGDDKPLFGRFTGTVWKPSHVRGSVKQGVVVSDYKANPPKQAS